MEWTQLDGKPFYFAGKKTTADEMSPLLLFKNPDLSRSRTNFAVDMYL